MTVYDEIGARGRLTDPTPPRLMPEQFEDDPHLRLLSRFDRERNVYHGVSYERRKVQRGVLIRFDATLAPQGKSIVDADASDLRAFLAGEIEDGYDKATVRKHLSMIRPFYEWLWESGAIDAERLMMFRSVKPPRGSSRQGLPRPYKRVELAGFWEEFDAAYPLPDDPEKWLRRWRNDTSPWRRVSDIFDRAQAHAIVCLALDGGLRRDEIYRLQLDDMNPGYDYVVVRGAAKNEDGVNRDRAVPFTDEMRDALRVWLDYRTEIAPAHDRPWLVLGRRERWARNAMRDESFRSLVGSIGRGWEFHRMRHTCATEMLRAGVELHVVSRILGHSRVQQTLVYTQILHDDVVRDHARGAKKFAAALRPPSRVPKARIDRWDFDIENEADYEDEEN